MKHDLITIKRISGGDFPKYLKECKECNKRFVLTYKALGAPIVIDIKRV
jgi:hypothetical protein